jgi:hypothetical protein
MEDMPDEKYPELCQNCESQPVGPSSNAINKLCCQYCGMFLCDYCAIWGHDVLPRCKECHFKHIDDCAICEGNIKEAGCEYCEYD